MANPTASDVYVNQLLTNISVAYMQGDDQFIAGKVFPDIPVEFQSGRFLTYNREEWFRTEAKLRAPATESAGGGWRIDNTPTYYTPVYAVHKDIDDQTRANQQRPMNLDREATMWVSRQMLLKKEILWVNQVFTTGVWGTDVTGVSSGPTGNQVLQWNNANATPIQDIDTYRLQIAQTTGYMPNTLVVGPQAYVQLKNHPTILERIKYTQRGIITPQLLAELFDIDNVFIPYVIQNTAAEGLAGVYSFLYGKAVLLMYVNPNPGLMVPSAGYTFAWTGLLGAAANGTRMKSFRIDPIESDRLEGEMAVDMHVMGAPLGVFFNSVVA